MAELESLEERVFYEDKERGIKFVQYPKDIGSYHVFIGEDNFYIPDGVISDLASQKTETSDIRDSFQAMNPNIRYILEKNNITYQDIHIALLKVKIQELEEQIENYYEAD
jgi:hypothetical protein